MLVLKLLLSLILIASATGECRPKTRGQCTANEEFVVEQYRCQNTCEFYGRYFNCNYNAPKGDCYCKKGFARLEECGPCISITNPICKSMLPPTAESCSKKPNEYFISTGSLFLCGNTCENHLIPCDRVTIQVVQWLPVCECKAGYARLNGKCVSLDYPACYELYKPSPETCSKRKELYSPFGSACQRSCKDYDEYNMCWDEKGRGTNKTRLILIEGCYCPKGTTRYINGSSCIPIKDCPNFKHKK